MARWLPYAYGAVLLAETAVLTVVYALWMPRASDPIGLWLGVLGLLSMVVLLVYSVARRSRTVRRMARLSAWLHLHIFLALQGVLFVFFHCLPLLGRLPHLHLLNPGMLNLGAVAVVFGSGLFGRYLYAQVPKTMGGQHMAREAVDAELQALSEEEVLPAEILALRSDKAPTAGSILDVLRADLRRRETLRKIRRANIDGKVKSLAMRCVRLERQRAVLDVAQRWFRSWIFLHRPIAAAMYVLSVVHVLLALMFAPHLRFF